MKKIEVVAAIMLNEEKILCVQRDKGKFDYINFKWEFPGGKVEKDETLENAIKREIKEELMANIVECEHFMTVEHQYPDFFLVMHSFLCHMPTKDISLTEHIASQWLSPESLDSLDWAAADIPIADKLREHFCDI